MLYYSLIYPFFIYGFQVWGLTYPTYLTSVTTLQKRIARIKTFSEPVSNSEPLLKSLNLLKFNDIIHSEILSFVYQWFHKLVPSCFVDFFKPISSIHEYPARQSLNENLFIKIDSNYPIWYSLSSLHWFQPLELTTNSTFARCRHLTTTTIILFVFSLLFKFWIPCGV